MKLYPPNLDDMIRHHGGVLTRDDSSNCTRTTDQDQDNYRCSEETSHVYDRNLKEFVGRLRATSVQAAIGDVLEEYSEVSARAAKS